MGDKDNGPLIVLQHLDQFSLELIFKVHVKRREGLVQQDHIRLIRHDARQRCSLLLASGELSGELLLQSAELKFLHHLTHAPRIFPSAALQAGSDVLLHRHSWKKRVILEQISHIPFLGLQVHLLFPVKKRAPLHCDLSLVRSLDPGDALKRHALSAAGCTKYADPPRCTAEADIKIEDVQLLMDLNRYRHCLPPPDILHLLA